MKGENDETEQYRHVVSGQTSRFASSEELLAFITHVLGELSKQATEEP